MIYDESQFTREQLDEIKEGLDDGLDVSVYAKTEFNPRQMEEIRFGLQDELDVSIYANPQLDSMAMMGLRHGLVDSLDVRPYATPDFTFDQIWRLNQIGERGLDVTRYAKPELTTDQLDQMMERDFELLKKAQNAKSITGVVYGKNASKFLVSYDNPVTTKHKYRNWNIDRVIPLKEHGQYTVSEDTVVAISSQDSKTALETVNKELDQRKTELASRLEEFMTGLEAYTRASDDSSLLNEALIDLEQFAQSLI